MVNCICDPLELNGHKYIQFIGSFFKICAYTPRDVIGFLCGLINIGFWLFAQTPQLWVTFKNKNPGNISVPFLTIWLVGDIANIIGCILTNQTKIQLYTSIYFIIMDVLVLGQIIYYAKFYKKPQQQHTKPTPGHSDSYNADYVDTDEGSDYADDATPQTPALPRPSSRAVVGSSSSSKLTTTLAVCIAMLSIMSTLQMTDAATTISVLSANIQNTAHIAASHLVDVLAVATAPICDDMGKLSPFIQSIGTICAWVCGFLYFTARIPQALKNHREKSTRGISFALFLMSFLANIFYAISILIPNTAQFGTAFWRDTFPYLLGSIGANIFSFVVMVQFFKYPALPEEEEEETGGLWVAATPQLAPSKTPHEPNMFLDVCDKDEELATFRLDNDAPQSNDQSYAYQDLNIQQQPVPQQQQQQ